MSEIEEISKRTKNADKMPNDADKMPISADKILMKHLTAQQKILFDHLEENGQITSHQAEILLNVKQRRARIILGEMVDLGILERNGSYRSTVYVLRK